MERRKTSETGRQKDRPKTGRDKVRFLEAKSFPEQQNRGVLLVAFYDTQYLRQPYSWMPGTERPTLDLA